MTLIIDSGFNYDTDASAYIDAVEVADGQSLETATRYAINNFVIGCKQDGIWTAIKASCILAGARTLAGALVPLAGAAPTNFNFVAGDYNRKTGLLGNASTKFLNSNRNNNADPQNSFHLSVYASTLGTTGYGIAQGSGELGTSMLGLIANVHRSRSSLFTNINAAVGFVGHSRSQSTSFTHRAALSNTVVTIASQSPANPPLLVFARGTVGVPETLADARIAFYSIGESLDLTLFDARVTTLINSFATSIP